MTKNQNSKYNVETLPEAQALLVEKSEELESFFGQILSYVDDPPSLEEIKKFQGELRRYDIDVFVLRNSLKKVRDNSDAWVMASDECKDQIEEISRFETKLASQRRERELQLEKNALDFAVLLFNASVPPSALAAIAKLTGASDTLALSVAVFFSTTSVGYYFSKRADRLWNGVAKILTRQSKRNSVLTAQPVPPCKPIEKGLIAPPRINDKYRRYSYHKNSR